jgi:two-component system CheB/CheR fusion protein
MGASAGGFEAFKQLLEKLPPDTKMAFVLVQHLDPSHESKLTDLLSHATSLPLLEARDRLAVAPGHVYVMAPNTGMVIKHGILRVTPRAATGHNLPVDRFLQSLAEDQGQRAIGVILSGTASDGAMGVQAIKIAGGITFAQDEETAKYPGMPRNAVATGCVDFVMPPAAIAQELAHIGEHPYVHLAGAEAAMADDGLMTVFRLMRTRTGVDFTHYKPATIQRRIQRRMALHRLKRLADYTQLLQTKPGESEALYADLLINVTGFFRDAEVFQALRKRVFPRLISGRPESEPIRIWVPGCSTGEEVYSLAIGLLEHLGSVADRVPIQIFGTDISEKALEKARAGFYPENIDSNLSPALLRRFFVRATGGYRVSKAVRERCVFAPHDLIKDPPFSNLDLISCRNVLIYFGPLLQKRILPTFHYALKPGGYLLLGKSETINGFANLFAVVDKPHRIFSPKVTTTRTSFEFMSANRPPQPAVAVRSPAPSGSTEPDVKKEADRLLMGRFAPPSVLVNEDMEILQFRGHTGPFLEHEAGAANLNLLRMVREDLALELRAALTKARKQGTPVRHSCLDRDTGAGRKTVAIEVIPMRKGQPHERHFLILFAESAEPGAASALPLPAERRESVVRLRQELSTTRESHREIVEELQTANEELKAVNEEIQSSKSTNEEMETAKEELQSANEELSTVNDELQTRTIELGQLNDDLINLLASVNIPILVLGSDLRIRRFTPMAEKILGLLPTDVGRAFTSLRLPLDMPHLEQMITAAMEDLSVKQRDVQHRDGHWYALQVRPYRTTDNRIDGAVIALWDVDVAKHALQQVRDARDYSEAIFQTVSNPLLVLDGHLRVQVANKAFYRMFEVEKPATEGRSLFDLGNGQWNLPRIRRLLKQVLTSHAKIDAFRVERDFPKIGHRAILLTARRMADETTDTPPLLLAFEDVSAREQVNLAQARLASMLESSFDAITGIDLKGRIITWNKAAERLYGYTAREAMGKPISMIIPPDHTDEIPAILRGVRRGQRCVGHESVRVNKQGQRIDVAVTVSPIMDANGRLVGSSAIVRDITAQKRAEAALQESETKFRAIFDAAADGMFLREMSSRQFYLANKVCLRMLGYSLEEFKTLDLEDLHPREDLTFIRGRIAALGRSEVGVYGDVRFRRKDGSLLMTELKPTLVTFGGKRYALVAIRDITERKRMEAEILNASEAERQRIGGDLHDGLSQSLPAIGYLISAVQAELAGKSLPEAAPLKKIARLVERDVQRMHSMARGLFPMELKRGGIAGALRELATHSEELLGVTCRVAGLTEVNLTDDHVARQLYRIAQEAVHNAARHSKGKNIWIRLARQRGRIVLTVRDDGSGIRRTLDQHAGLGLRIMKYRANMIGATLTIDSTPGTGTIVTCLVPPHATPPKELAP